MVSLVFLLATIAIAAPTPSRISNLVLFGDSFTDTHIQYDIDSIPSHPIDTKTPVFPPYTYGYSASGRSTNGGGWVDYFQNSTGIYNNNTANEACACGTTDDRLVSTPCTFLSGLRSVRQMQQTFRQVYNNGTDFDPATTLYIIWIGYNDIQQVAQSATPYTVDQIVQNHYSTNLVPLAPLSNNFLFINLSPLDLAPKWANDPFTGPKVKSAVTQWNTAISNATKTFQSAYPNKWVGEYDMYSLFNRMISGDLKTKFDFEYFTRCDLDFRCNNNGTLVNQFFYWNDLHPTSKTHFVISEHLREYLVSQGFSFPMNGSHATVF